jgi:DNA-binding NarL/FixJ family response regulator
MVGVEALGYRCPVCDGTPCVGVAVEYRGVRKLIGELLDRDGGCWQICPLHAAAEMPAQVGAGTRPALVIVDAADLPRCCRDTLGPYPRGRVVVIGPEPDPAYANAALRAGAGAWLCRERIGEELGAAMRTLLGCTHRPGLVP